jgi:hypothetical protein
VLVVLGVVAIGLAITASHPYKTLAPVAPGDAAMDSANQKLVGIAARGIEARARGGPVPFRATFSDEELTSLLAGRMPRNVFTDTVMRAGDGNLIEGNTTAHVGPLATPIYFQVTVAAEGGHPAFHVVETKAGQLGIPGVFDGLLAGALQGVPLANQVINVQDVTTTTAPGQTTVAGTAVP